MNLVNAPVNFDKMSKNLLAFGTAELEISVTNVSPLLAAAMLQTAVSFLRRLEEIVRRENVGVSRYSYNWRMTMECLLIQSIQAPGTLGPRCSIP